ncbi:C6 zinc finger domain-containing [Pyrenophora seminiperda CCB06]|uniref:C6 zinc finger domain-containing n=1 Tax=Pyrenophora seminiperda CCB06 TaxID=1302712 RepID=A0A3M7M3D2_9PLEO|nr:C6 zinc finger domain-containing [Pyrenophora seminiperda CCB06]
MRLSKLAHQHHLNTVPHLAPQIKAGQTMQSLSLPGPTSLLSAPFGRPVEAEDGLAKFRTKFSPHSSEHQGYPSPPMSEPHSPSRRLAQPVESARYSYPPAVGVSQRQDSLTQPPATSSVYDPRSGPASHSHPLQRPLYPGDHQHRGQAPHYQHGYALEHQSYGHAISNSYGYGYQNASLPYAGLQHTGPMVHQGVMVAPPPARPTKPARRTKAHVASACVNCKKAHLSCDVQRPCGRCVASGKQLLGAPPTSEAPPHQPPFGAHLYRPSDQRVLSGTTHHRDVPSANSHTATPATRDATINAGDAVLPPLYNAGPNPAYQKLPVAYLNLDLVIQKTNQAFADLVSFLGNIRGKHLGDLLEARQNESLQRLRNELRDERDEREPTYMAPITPVGQDPMRAVMESVADQDIDHVTQGFTNRSIFLSFRVHGGGQYQSLQVQIRLAKTSLYFVTLVVCSPPRLTAPPLLTQQLAPPTPRHGSQSNSAPTTATVTQFTPHHPRPPSSTSSAPNSPFFNFSSIRTSLPAFSPSSYSSSPSHRYSPIASGAESAYFPTYQPPPQLTSNTYPSPYAANSRLPAATSEPLRESNRPARLEGLHLPPIRTGPPPLGSPLHIETGSNTLQRERERGRLRDSPPSGAEQRRPKSPETGKRRRLNIHEVLE